MKWFDVNIRLPTKEECDDPCKLFLTKTKSNYYELLYYEKIKSTEEYVWVDEYIIISDVILWTIIDVSIEEIIDELD